jgi:hypothetical protein
MREEVRAEVMAEVRAEVKAEVRAEVVQAHSRSAGAARVQVPTFASAARSSTQPASAEDANDTTPAFTSSRTARGGVCVMSTCVSKGMPAHLWRNSSASCSRGAKVKARTY